MQTKVKIFTVNHISALETNINKLLENQEISLRDIKLNTYFDKYDNLKHCAIVIYEEE